MVVPFTQVVLPVFPQSVEKFLQTLRTSPESIPCLTGIFRRTKHPCNGGDTASLIEPSNEDSSSLEVACLRADCQQTPQLARRYSNLKSSIAGSCGKVSVAAQNLPPFAVR